MNLSRDPDTIFNGSCIVVKDTVTLPIFLPPIVSFFFLSFPLTLLSSNSFSTDSRYSCLFSDGTGGSCARRNVRVPGKSSFRNVHETMASNHDRWKIDESIRGSILDGKSSVDEPSNICTRDPRYRSSGGKIKAIFFFFFFFFFLFVHDIRIHVSYELSAGERLLLIDSLAEWFSVLSGDLGRGDRVFKPSRCKSQCM